MKKVRVVSAAMAFLFAIVGAFASVSTSPLLTPKGNVPGTGCVSGTLQSPPSGTCAVQSGTACKVRINNVDYDAFDSSCTSGNEIRYQ